MYKERLDKLLMKKSELSVAVIYASAYGNTGIMADAISFGLRDQVN
jgi:flavorubredoxin